MKAGCRVINLNVPSTQKADVIDSNDRPHLVHGVNDQLKRAAGSGTGHEAGIRKETEGTGRAPPRSLAPSWIVLDRPNVVE